MDNQGGPQVIPPNDKIKAFNLLEITQMLMPYLREVAPLVCEYNDVLKVFKYVKFYWGEVYFYSEEYVNNHDLYQLEAEFNKILSGFHHD